MFVRGLWQLHQQMVLHFMESAQPKRPVPIHCTTMSDVLDIPSIDNENISDLDGRKTPSLRRKNSMDIVLDEWNQKNERQKNRLRNEVERIVKLHNLIKKQAILVCIATGATTLNWIATALKGEMLWMNGWDNIINAVCVWMMLEISKRYWDVCRLYGCCWCCYRRTNQVGM